MLYVILRFIFVDITILGPGELKSVFFTKMSRLYQMSRNYCNNVKPQYTNRKF